MAAPACGRSEGSTAPYLGAALGAGPEPKQLRLGDMRMMMRMRMRMRMTTMTLKTMTMMWTGTFAHAGLKRNAPTIHLLNKSRWGYSSK